MSADNGIYILTTPCFTGSENKEYRVAGCQAIDNLTYEVPDGFDLDPVYVVMYFGRCQVLHDPQTALIVAGQMLSESIVCEYGIQYINAQLPWCEYSSKYFNRKEPENVGD